jgi:hypothetical protein
VGLGFAAEVAYEVIVVVLVQLHQAVKDVFNLWVLTVLHVFGVFFDHEFFPGNAVFDVV